MTIYSLDVLLFLFAVCLFPSAYCICLWRDEAVLNKIQCLGWWKASLEQVTSVSSLSGIQFLDCLHDICTYSLSSFTPISYESNVVVLPVVYMSLGCSSYHMAFAQTIPSLWNTVLQIVPCSSECNFSFTFSHRSSPDWSHSLPIGPHSMHTFCS